MKVITIAAALATGAALLAGCADGGSGLGLTTSSVSPSPVAAKSDPACATLASQIGALRSEGVADKVEKAAAKKYKMTTADLAKADQLNKANAEFQGKCAPAPQQTAAADTAASSVASQAATQATAKATDAATAKAASAAASAAKQ